MAVLPRKEQSAIEASSLPLLPLNKHKRRI